jgi:hypothetical protein
MPRPTRATPEQFAELVEALEPAIDALNAVNRAMDSHFDVTVVPTIEQVRTATALGEALSTFTHRTMLLWSHAALKAATEAQVRAEIAKGES